MDLLSANDQLNSIRDFLAQKPEVNTVYLHGSLARGDALSSSDIDIGIYLGDNFKPDLYYLGDLIVRLNDLVKGRKVDISIINNMSPLYRFNVVYHNRVLYCRDFGKKAEFELKTRRDYEDYLPFFNYRTEMAVKEAKRRINDGKKSR